VVNTGTVVSLGELLWSEDIRVNCCRKLTFTEPKCKEGRPSRRQLNSKQQYIQMVRQHRTRYADG
jgi:hypothetical protein